MTILFLEDEKLAAKKVQKLIIDYFDDIPAIHWVKSIKEGLAFLQNNPSPDLIISDIELLDGNVFALYEQFSVKSPIIFATAYDQFLLKAFQTNGIAYLLKPFDTEQFNETLDKYQQLFSPEEPTGLSKNVIQDLKEALSASQKEYKSRFVIKKKNGIFLLNTNDVIFFQADGDIVFALDNKNKKHIVQNRLSEIEAMINPSRFFRINRSEIIHIDYIEKIEAYFNNRLMIHFPNVKEGLTTSTSKTATFRKWIEK